MCTRSSTSASLVLRSLVVFLLEVDLLQRSAHASTGLAMSSASHLENALILRKVDTNARKGTVSCGQDSGTVTIRMKSREHRKYATSAELAENELHQNVPSDENDGRAAADTMEILPSEVSQAARPRSSLREAWLPSPV